MNTALKIGGYTLGLLAVFGAAVGIGAAVTPTATSAATSSPTPEDHSDMSAMTTPAAAGDVSLPGGLMVSQDGYTLTLADPSLPTGPTVPLRFQILGPDGNPVTGYQTAHDKDLHLIVVRRDLSGFQHVHPTLAPDGTWSVPVDLSAAGQYRVFADFAPTGREGGLVLGADLAVSGTYEPVPLPEPVATTQVVDGYEVTLAGNLTAGQESELTLTVSKDGVPVTDLQPYLGAYGHLVALRSGDLAYLHVHPAGEPGDGVTPAGPGITFYATAPSSGDYRLFLDFQHNGVVRTAEFTVQTGETARPATSPSNPATAATSTVPAAQTQTDTSHDDTETGSHGH
ncbi:hypothetical protein ACVBEQ_03850 [Nakamurella sp. GG22]